MLGLFYKRLLTGSVVLNGCLLVFMVISISADVFGRYFFNHPIGWVVEICEHALMALPFLSMAWLVNQNGHVMVDMVVRALSPKLQKRVGFITYCIGAGICGFGTYYAILVTWDNYVRAVSTAGIYPIPKPVLLSIIAFGLLLTTIEFLRKAKGAFGCWMT